MRWLAAAWALVIGLILVAAGSAAAHEVRPAYLEIDQASPLDYRIMWKQPAMGDLAIHLEPHLSSGWLEKPPSDSYASPAYLMKTWTLHASRSGALDGQSLSIEGLQDTITDVVVRIQPYGGQGQDVIIHPEQPTYAIRLARGASLAAPAFLILGISHILTGPDHLLFVLGLLLLVRDRRMLLKTVTAFTVAHSLTLGAASFGLVSVPTALLNVLIALSILFLAPEILRERRGGTSLTIRHPWIVAFAFGLLHGLGFANGLKSLGLERSALLGALVLFNIGVEVGQLVFIALILALRRAFRLMAITWPRLLALAPTYVMGALSAAWMFQYGALLFGAGE